MQFEDIANLTLDQCKARQRQLRHKITGCCTRTRRVIASKLSRREAERLLTEARGHLSDSSLINDRLLELLNDEEGGVQHEQFLRYGGDIDSMAEAITEYLASRAGETASVIGDTANQELIDAEQRVLESQRMYEEAAKAAEAAKKMMEDAAKAVHALKNEVEDSHNDDISDTSSIYSVAVHPRPPRAITAPDDWIEEYCEGKERQLVQSGDNRYSSIRVDLDVYSGRTLDWFEWISLFHALVHRTGKSPGEKLAILKRNVRGETADMVYGLGGGEEAYKDALLRLKTTCGSRSVMRAAHLQALDKIDVPRGDPASLRRFAEKVRTHLFNLSCIGETGDADIIERLAQKLQIQDRLSWNDGRRGGLECRSMNEFGSWLCLRASAYQNAYAIASDQSSRPSSNARSGQGQQQTQLPHQHSGRRNVRTHYGDSTGARSDNKPPSEEKKTPDHCFKCEGAHRLHTCTFFKALTVSERITFVIRRGLCFCCFGVRHAARDCREKKSCGIGGCKLLHHQLLHNDVTTRGARTCHAIGNGSERIAFGVIQLEALNPDGESIPITVMVDPGSNATLFREGIVRSLKLRGRRQTLYIDGVADAISTLHNSEHLEMKIRTAFGELVTLEGSTLPSITRPVPFFRWEDLRKRWHHLEGLPELLPAGGRIDVLVGLNHSAFTTATESRIGNDNEPTAEKTRLGWILKGVVDGIAVNARVHQALASTDIGFQLLDQMRRFCDTETFGTEYQIDCISPENKAASEFLDQTTRRLEIGYEAPVLWKNGVRPVLPDNRSLAETRLQYLINKFQKTPPEQRYEYWYRKAMQKNFDEGYACRLSPEETASQAGYYLPHFGVPKIPGRPELRLVYDAAAKYRGRCLNDYIVSGPAVQKPLAAVIIRFREGAVAWSADIRAMFSRIRLQKEDRRYHRFLWPEEDGSISTCEMTRVTFGVSCSPFVAIRTMWRAADDAGPDMKSASEAVRNNLYVDDYLGSARSREEAISVTKAVSTVLAGGDFHLGSWASNDFTVLTSLQPSENENGNKELTTRDLGSDDVETVLGITWRPTTDMLGFRVKEKEVTFTRIGLASMVAGQFDPQGTAAPMTVKGKIRLRELGVRGLGWNETVNENDIQWWTQYFNTVQQLRDVEFPRGLFPNEENIVQSELHTFADASEEACAAVCYIRHSYQDGSVVVRHVKAATKLAPLKTVSVCKLELTAALLGARLARFVGESMTRQINIRRFWTDSSTVRNWVRAVSAQYQVYVSHRIGEIQTLTAAHEWRFVPGRLNPADAATRSQLEAEAIPLYWLDGPPFLYADPAGWPKDLPWLVEKQEIRSIHLHLVESHPKLTTDWSTITITAKEIPALIRLEEKYRSLIQLCQEEVYPEELKRLRGKKPIKPTSRLITLTPFLGDDKLLHLGGRLGRAKLPYDVLHPPILPGPHPLARSVIRAFHDEMHHVGTDFVLSHVRQHFWITAGREAVKRVRNECIPCRRFRPKAALQMMADVHKARLGAREPPFTYTSVDYFGPIDVIHGRGTAKRWGALFTCLVTRALYVDVAVSLSADDFLLVLRRFASIYRKPAHMFSDNGTNLVGGERILREELERLKVNDGLTAELKGLGINWTFQPAQTPHFGGSHESLVRSVKNALYAALDQEKLGLRKPSDEILRTILFEVSGLLNARPLTYVSSDPDDFRPLTPNDFLNRAPVADLPAGDFSHSLPREHYRYVQRITNLFWDLWHGAFLQSMVGRKKWQSPARNLAIGDFVLDDWKDAPRGRWRTGKVSNVYPGADGLVRAVDVQFSTGILRRGTNQLALLEACSLDPEGIPTSSSGEYGAANII